MIDLATCTPLGDKKNSEFFDDYLPRIYERRKTAGVVGECKDEPNRKQIFSKASRYSLLITEYVERCHGYEGFFTRDNVAALTEAAGAAERYDHGHAFD